MATTPTISALRDDADEHGKISCVPDIQRLLPQSADAEQGVLGSFLLAPSEAGKKCREMGLAPGHFHGPGNRIIFERLQHLHAERIQIDLLVLTQTLRDQNLLDAVGGTIKGATVSGAAYLTELQVFLPSALNVECYIDVVLEKSALREAIRVCTEYTNRFFQEQDQAPALLAEFLTAANGVAQSRSPSSLRLALEARRFDVTKPPAKPVPAFSLGQSTIATPGNILAIQAKAKVGKTALVEGAIAATMEPQGDCLGIKSSNPLNQCLLHFDTEQSPWDHHLCIRRALQRAGRNEPPAWLWSYRVADLNFRQRREAVVVEIQRAHQSHGGLLAVIIDGIGDLCADPNDPQEAFALVDEMHQLAIGYDTVIACVLHENPGSEYGKTRGHLGSHLERKAETNLRLEKDDEGVTVVFTERARHTHIPKAKGACFSWNEEKQMQHTLTDAAFKGAAAKGKHDPNAPRKNAASTTAKAALEKHFAHGATVRRATLATQSGIPSRTFDKYWAVLRDNGWIQQDAENKAIWTATPTWGAVLAADYPEAGEP